MKCERCGNELVYARGLCSPCYFTDYRARQWEMRRSGLASEVELAIGPLMERQAKPREIALTVVDLLASPKSRAGRRKRAAVEQEAA